VEILGSTLQSQRSLPQQAQGSTGGTGVELQSQSSLQRWSCGLWWRGSSWASGCMPRDWATPSLPPPGSLQLEEPRGTQLYCRQAHSPHTCQYIDDGPHRLLLISSMLMCMCKRRQPTQLALELPTEPNTVGDCLHVCRVSGECIHCTLPHLFSLCGLSTIHVCVYTALMPAGTQFSEAVQDAPEFTKALSPRPHLHFQAKLQTSPHFTLLWLLSFCRCISHYVNVTPCWNHRSVHEFFFRSVQNRNIMNHCSLLMIIMIIDKFSFVFISSLDCGLRLSSLDCGLCLSS
jgi:hypothetical protein